MCYHRICYHYNEEHRPEGQWYLDISVALVQLQVLRCVNSPVIGKWSELGSLSTIYISENRERIEIVLVTFHPEVA